MNKQTTYKPPIEVQNNAKRALEVRRQKPRSQRAMTDVGLARARDLANGRPQSLDTIQRMVSFFARHEVDKQSQSWGSGSKGWQAWMGWGGDAGRRWAERILAEALKDDEVKKSPTVVLSTPLPVVETAPAPVGTPPVSLDDEGAMALGQLRAIADKASRIATVLTPNSQLEGWVQSKITEAAQSINAVHDYLLYSPKEARMNKTFAKRQERFGGVPREKLEDVDFVIAEERKFPVMTAKDVKDAVASWGRYKGDMDFDTFKSRLIELATQKGLEDALPDLWKEEMEAQRAMTQKTAFAKFLMFEKASREQRVVVGYASSERVDGQNDIVDSEALKNALDDYMQWANLREMHQPKAVGKVLSAVPVKGTVRLSDGTVLKNPLRIIAKIVDEDAWQKVKSGILKGFSIGGKVKNAITQKVNGQEVRRITDLVLNEISLVDRPANPDARIVMLKRADAKLDKFAIEAHVKNGGDPEVLIAKAKVADPQDILPMVQQLRNQAEIDGDLDTAERYNEVITLMLEAMGIIPTGTVREIDDMEDMEYPGEDTPADLADMDALYGNGDDTAKRRNAIMYADKPTDIMKVGRAISKSNMDALSDIYRAAKIIMAVVERLGVNLEEQEHHEAEEAEEEPEEIVVVSDIPEKDGDVPTSAAENEPDIMNALANAPQKMMPGNNTGSPIHTPMNPNAPAQNVTGGYPIYRADQPDDLLKGSTTADEAVDIAQLEEEMQSMETPIENAPPVPAEESDVTKSAPDAVANALQEVISKSLQGALAGTVAQLHDVAKAVERIEAKSAETSVAVWDAIKPITETANATKSLVEPLVEKVAALESVAESVQALAARIENLEKQPVDAPVVVRGGAVNKALGGDTGAAPQQDEAETLQKMLDETRDPLVRTKLQERLAYIQTKRALFGAPRN